MMSWSEACRGTCLVVTEKCRTQVEGQKFLCHREKVIVVSETPVKNFLTVILFKEVESYVTEPLYHPCRGFLEREVEVALHDGSLGTVAH